MTEEVTTTANGAAAPTSIDDLQVGMELKGTIKRIELYGAFVDIGIKTDALLHISQLGKPNVRNVEDVVKVGETHTVYVLKVEKDTKRIALSLSKPPAVTWNDLKVGSTVTGKVTRLTKFGVFVDIGAEREALIHVSELAAGYVNQPSDVVKVGDEITAQVINVDSKLRRIDLSKKALEAPARPERVEIEDVPEEKLPTAMELAFRRAGENEPTGKVIPAKWDKRNQKYNKRDRRQHDLEDVFERTLRGEK
ncbi:S1 RNA-binding domain-containing protein [Anaerolineae bacterium CFX9]|jgi:ribosomal protein S1|nr:S1 RNA-binding domain-containing protein [Anaerolineae bacterium CFX9]